MSRRSALGTVLGLGSAKEGVSHWWGQRVSAVALLPLALWLIFSLTLRIRAGQTDYLSTVDWIAVPFNAVMLILFIATVSHHASLGVQVVIEDYVRGGTKVFWLVLQKFVLILAATAGIFSVLRIALAS